jgi:hypothetical protein
LSVALGLALVMVVLEVMLRSRVLEFVLCTWRGRLCCLLSTAQGCGSLTASTSWACRAASCLHRSRAVVHYTIQRGPFLNPLTSDAASILHGRGFERSAYDAVLSALEVDAREALEGESEMDGRRCLQGRAEKSGD